MSTPTTTVRFQIAVPTTDGDGCTTDKMYFLTLNLQVEGPADGEIRVSLLPEVAIPKVTESEPMLTDPLPGEAPVFPDPPKPN